VNAAELTALRLRACHITRELGTCLACLDQAEELQRLPGTDAAADALLLHEHLDEAAAAADSLCAHGDDLVTEIDRLVQRADLAARPFLGGAA
jgi:hypothetical protein